MIFVGLAMTFLAGWLARWALDSWVDLRLPPATARQLARAARANRADLRRLRIASEPTPPALDHFEEQR